MTKKAPTSKFKKFRGQSNEDYRLWRLRVETALRGKDYWENVSAKGCDKKILNRATAVIVAALGDSPFRVCASAVGDPMEMLNLLDKRYASKRTTSRISLLTSIYSKRYSGKSMSKYIDELSQLFAQLETMGEDARLPDSHQVAILLASIGNYPGLESTVAALRLRDADDLSWECVTSDLIEEYDRMCLHPGRIKQSGSTSGADRSSNKSRGDHRHSANISKKGGEHHEGTCKCEFCGKAGHTADKCFNNPASPNCRLTDQARKSLQAMAAKGKRKNEKSEKSITFGGYACYAAKQLPENPPCLDSGASTTMFRKAASAEKGTYRQGCDDTVQLAAGNSVAQCIGTGSLKFGNLQIPNAVQVESLNGTLVSVGDICDQGKIVVFTKECAIVLNTKKFTVDASMIVVKVPRNEYGLYCFQETASKNESNHAALITSKSSADINLWHRRLIHANEDVIKHTHKSATGTDKLTGEMIPCHPCALGKASKRPFKSKFQDATVPGEIVHSDLAGPLPKSHTGSKYMITFTDQATRYINVVCTSAKSDTSDAYEAYKHCDTAKHFPSGVQRLHTDGGGEYVAIDMEESHTEHTSTAPYTPEHNPFAERANRTIFDPVRTMLEEAGLSARYWDHAAQHAAHVKNRIYNKQIGCSPYEKLTGNIPSVKYLKVFGCAAFVYNNHPKSKVHSRGQPGIVLGCSDHGIYKVELSSSRKIVYTRHVTFDESSFPALEEDSSSSSSSSVESEEHESREEDISKHDVDGTMDSESDAEIGFNQSDDGSEGKEMTASAQSRPRREVRPPDRYAAQARVLFAGSVITVPITTSDTPTVKQALEESTPEERELWLAAIQEELDSLSEKQTWKPVENDPRLRALPTHIILRIKRDENGNPIRFKARIVVGGHLQRPGIDFDNVYSPVVDFALVRSVMAIVLHNSWYAKHVDVRTAFLNGDIDRDIRVMHPTNLPKHMKLSQVYQLQKALYGLHQAPLAWNNKLHEELLTTGYIQLASDRSVYIREEASPKGKRLVVVLVYVDDLIFVSNEENALIDASEEFLEIFEGTDLGDVSWYLGVHIKLEKGKCVFSQTAFIDEVLKEHQMEDANVSHTPMASNFYDELNANTTQKVINNTQYRSIIGSLLFLSTRTRPDICTAVGILSQYVDRPTPFLLHSAKRVLRYLKKTRLFGLTYYADQTVPPILQVAVDADFAANKEDRKSRSGFTATLNNCLLDWYSRKQNSTALCTAEAEYFAMSEGCKLTNWLRLFLAEIHQGSSKPTVMHVDNQAAQTWAKSTANMRRAKHIEIRYHYVRECVGRGSIEPVYIASEQNTADGFTKALDRTKFEKFREIIGVQTN